MTTLRDHPTVADLLREAFEIAKKRDGLTQTALAARLGIKQQTVSGWINGDRNPDAADYARFLYACGAPRRLYMALRDVVPINEGSEGEGLDSAEPL